VHISCVASAHVEDWRCDQLQWVNQSIKELSMKNPVVQKMYFQTHLPLKSFTKEAYMLLDPCGCDVTLIHFLGNEKIAESSPHGNSKGDTQRNFTV